MTDRPAETTPSSATPDPERSGSALAGELGARLTKISGRVRELCGELNEIRSVLLAETQALAHEHKQLHQNGATHAAPVEANGQQRAAADRSDEERHARETELAAWAQTLEKRRATLAQEEQQLQQRTAALTAQAREAEQRRATLARDEDQVHQRTTELKDLRRRLDEQHSMLRQREAEIDELRARLDEEARTLAQTAQTLDHRAAHAATRTASAPSAAPPDALDDLETAPEHEPAVRGRVTEPDGSVDESRLNADLRQKLRVLRRITGGKISDKDLLARIARDESQPTAAGSDKKSKRRWWS